MKAGMRLENVDVAFIAVYYGALLIGGSWMWAEVIQSNNDASSVTLLAAVQTAMFASLAAASVFYVRKLYKDVFAALDPSYERGRTSRIATIIYYMSRPLFASLISIISTVFLFEFIHAMSVGHVGASFNFLLFSTVGSALISIATGVAVERIEAVAKHGDTVFRPHV